MKSINYFSFCIGIYETQRPWGYHIQTHNSYYLAYRTGQSVDLTVIGNLVFTPSRDLVFPLSRDQRN